MKTYFCSSCKRETGFKRALGWGTFFACILTGGLWLLTIPFYPKRCIVCGNKYTKKVDWGAVAKNNANRNIGKLLLIGIFAMVVVSVLMAILSKTEPEKAVSKGQAVNGELVKSISVKTESDAESSPNWIRLFSSKSNSCSYDKNSVKKLAEKLRKVEYACGKDSENYVLKEIRINCDTMQVALGKANGFKYGKLVSELDFSKNGWVWISPIKDSADSKLTTLLCK